MITPDRKKTSKKLNPTLQKYLDKNQPKIKSFVDQLPKRGPQQIGNILAPLMEMLRRHYDDLVAAEREGAAA